MARVVINDGALVAAILAVTLPEAKKRATKIQNRAKQLSPVDTGRLRSSIVQTPPEISRASVKIRIGTNVEYAPYVEFGTSKMRAQPFLRPALDAGR